MPNRSDLLIEIGVEELPSSYVDAALDALPALLSTRLAALRLLHGDIQSLGTPRRLSAIVHDISDTQTDVDEEVMGPPEAFAFKDEKPTKAAEAFAAKVGVDVTALSVVDKPAAAKQKAGRYVVARRVEKGRPATALLADAVVGVCGAIPFRKSMRWGDLDASFGRPVQWLVVLFGESILDATFAGVQSGNVSRGHRFLAPGPLTLKSARTYVSMLRAAHVLVDRVERTETMMRLVEEAAIAKGGSHDRAPSLVAENASLVEWPHVITGSFEPAFLGIPPAVIRSVARGHQKYFCVEKGEDELLPFYIAVANTAENVAQVTKGNDRVMRARLADAQFFFEEDKKVSIERRIEKLEGVIFHNRLGTVRAKVDRIEKLAGTIASKVGAAEAVTASVKRAAHLSKFDLVSLMVGEFPELQGEMGRAYAIHAGEDGAVADAIRDHYKPAGATDAIPTSDVSTLVGLADRLDSVVGCFGIGLAPTGAADPYALRRACIAILRILLERSQTRAGFAALNLCTVLGDAWDGYDANVLALGRDETVAKVAEFFEDRLRGLLVTATSSAVADAVLHGVAYVNGAAHGMASYPSYAFAKAKALHAVVESRAPWIERAKTVARRLNGIRGAANAKLHPRGMFTRREDGAIVDVVERLEGETRALETEPNVARALQSTEALAEALDAIFVSTLVNDPADALTPKRLELLSYGAECMARIADFSKLG